MKFLLPNVSLEEEEMQLIARASLDFRDAVHEDRQGALTIKQLRMANNQFGSDFATALLYAWLLQSADHGPFIKDFYENGSRILTRETLAYNSHPDKVLVVPGAFYQEYPETGATGEVVVRELESLGVPVERVPTRSVGTLQQNSDIICRHLSRQLCDTLALVSLSKGGADIKWALRQNPACFQRVGLWVNIGGVLSGSPLINWVQARPPLDWVNRIVFYWRGRDYRFFRQLARAPAGELDFELVLPKHLHAVHVAGFPLRKHALTTYAKIWHKRFASLGPNDAVMLLEDVLHLPGRILPLWGIDHYYSPKWDFRMLIHGMLRYWSTQIQPSGT